MITRIRTTRLSIWTQHTRTVNQQKLIIWSWTEYSRPTTLIPPHSKSSLKNPRNKTTRISATLSLCISICLTLTDLHQFMSRLGGHTCKFTINSRNRQIQNEIVSYHHSSSDIQTDEFCVCSSQGLIREWMHTRNIYMYWLWFLIIWSL